MTLQRCDLLERALDVHAADKQAKEAQAAVDNEAALRSRLEATSGERAALAAKRSAIAVPIPGALGAHAQARHRARRCAGRA